MRQLSWCLKSLTNTQSTGALLLALNAVHLYVVTSGGLHCLMPLHMYALYITDTRESVGEESLLGKTSLVRPQMDDHTWN